MLKQGARGQGPGVSKVVIPAKAGIQFLIFAVILLFSPGSFAKETADIFLTPEQLAPHQATIRRVEEYLGGLTTVVADFTQVAPDGSLATGKFYLKRPGMMRWQYNPPTPILMVTDGGALVFYDYELQQVNYIPLDSTLLGFMAQDQIRFGGMVGVVDIAKKDKVIRIALRQKEKMDEGELVLELSDNPLIIRNMIITDATQQTTRVSLNHAQFGTPIDKSLFEFHDPRTKRR